MPRRVSNEAKRLIDSLFEKDLSIAEIARIADVPYSTTYSYTRARQRINLETGKPFESYVQYKEHQTRRRRHELSDLVRRRLKELGKNQSWLAEKVGVSRAAVSLYATGRNIPCDDIFRKVCYALEVPYRILDDLVRDNAPV